MKLRYVIPMLLAAALASCATSTTTVTAPDGTTTTTKTTAWDTKASESVTKSAVELAPIVKNDK